MEKISNIIPPNARVTTVDLKTSGAARPGMPNYGREVGVTSPVKRAQIDAEQLAMDRHIDQMKLRESKGDPRSDIVKNLSDRFFNKQNLINSGELNLAPKAVAEGRSLTDIRQDKNLKVNDKWNSEQENQNLENDGEADGESLVVGQHLNVRA